MLGEDAEAAFEQALEVLRALRLLYALPLALDEYAAFLERRSRINKAWRINEELVTLAPAKAVAGRERRSAQERRERLREKEPSAANSPGGRGG